VGLEIIEGIVILGTFSATLIAALYYKSTLSGVKKAKKRNEISVYENLTQYREVEKGTITDILKQKDNQIKSLNARIKQYEPIEQEISTDGGGKAITFEEIQTLVSQTYPQYSKLLPLMKKQIMDMTKGMTLDEVLNYVKQFTGNKESQGQTSQTPDGYNPNWA